MNKVILIFLFLCVVDINGQFFRTKKRKNKEDCKCCPKKCHCMCTRPGLPICYKKLEVLLILDSSGSISSQDWITMKQFTNRLIDAFPNEKTKFALITFSDDAQLEWNFDDRRATDRNELRDAITNLQKFQGRFTNTPAAMRIAIDRIFNGVNDEKKVNNVALLLTDGQVTHRTFLNETIAELQSKTFVGAVGIGDLAVVKELQHIATGNGNNNVFQTDSFDELIEILNGITLTLCESKSGKLEREEPKCFCCCPAIQKRPQPQPMVMPCGGFNYGSCGDSMGDVDDDEDQDDEEEEEEEEKCRKKLLRPFKKPRKFFNN